MQESLRHPDREVRQWPHSKARSFPLRACRSDTWLFASASMRLSLTTSQTQNETDTLKKKMPKVLANEENMVALHQKLYNSHPFLMKRQLHLRSA